MKKVKISFLIGLLALSAQAAFNDEDLEALRARVRGLEKKVPKRMGEDFARQEGNEKINATLGINLVMGLKDGDHARFMSAAQEYFEAVGGGMFARANAQERVRREEAARKDREQAEAERVERERQERVRREEEEWAETQRKAREAREKADREAREKAEADRVERERQERMRREQEERAETQRKAREAREKADREAREARDAREKAEADAAHRAEEDRRHQEAAERRARQQREDEEKKAELERQRREAEKEKERRKAEREARERAEADGKAREARERAEREARERAEADRKARDAREKSEREAREEAEKSRRAAEEKARREEEDRRVKAQRIRVLENSTARRASQINRDHGGFVMEKERGDADIQRAMDRVKKASIDVHSGDQTDARARGMSVEALREEAYRMLDTAENTYLPTQVRLLEPLLASLRLQSEELTQLATLTKMSMEEMAQRRQALERLQQDLRQARRTFADIVPDTWEYQQASNAYSALELQSKALGDQFNQAVRNIALHEEDPHDGVRPFIEERNRISREMDALSVSLSRAEENVRRAKLRFLPAKAAQERIDALQSECDRVKQENEAAKHPAEENGTQKQIRALEEHLAKAREELANNGRVRAEARAKDEELLRTSPANAFKIIVSIPGKGMIGKFLRPQEVGGLQREYVLIPDDKAPKNGARFVFIATGLRHQNTLVTRDLKSLFGQKDNDFNFGSLPGFEAALKEQFVSTTSVQE